MLSLETLLLQCHSQLPSDTIPLITNQTQSVLFMFDGLELYKHNLDLSTALCSDPHLSTSVSCLVSSLVHGTLLKGASILLATRPTEGLESLDAHKVEQLGFLKPQRKSYFERFFTDLDVSRIGLQSMEQTVGFYDFCASPRFCWTICSLYKTLLDAGERLPETLTQVFVRITVHLLKELSFDEAQARALVLALGKMATHCCVTQHAHCSKDEMSSFGLLPFLTTRDSLDAFLHVDGDVESKSCVFSFHTPQMQEFILAVFIYLDKPEPESVEEMLQKHGGHVEFLDLYLSGLSNPGQRKSLEALIGKFNSNQIIHFTRWLKESSQKTLENRYKEKHLHCFRLLHQSQNKTLVNEIVSASAKIGISYGGLGLRDCVALNYMVTCRGEMEKLNLYLSKNLTEDEAELLVPAMCLSKTIILSQSSLMTGAISHLASALSQGRTTELTLSTLHGAKDFQVLCTGLRDCKVQILKLSVCQLTETCCGDLVSVLTSGRSQLLVLDLAFNELQDQGLAQLSRALQSPLCKLQELELQSCKLTTESMEALSKALCSNRSELKRLNLASNSVGDIGVYQLSKALQHPNCQLQSLILNDTELSGVCCAAMAEGLKSANCCLRELDLSVNELGQEGALLLCDALRQPGIQLQKRSLERCELTLQIFKELGHVLSRSTSNLKSLSVGLNKVGDQGVKHLWDALTDQHCLLEYLNVEMTGLTDACVPDLCAAVRASMSLRVLDLRVNGLTDVAVPALVEVMQEIGTMQEMW
ncbi:LOW QUALITY PROTEIN: NACHT, LRR and PYD domains-containing protein 12 [Aplochiton taeniatus]